MRYDQANAYLLRREKKVPTKILSIESVSLLYVPTLSPVKIHGRQWSMQTGCRFFCCLLCRLSSRFTLIIILYLLWWRMKRSDIATAISHFVWIWKIKRTFLYVVRYFLFNSFVFYFFLGGVVVLAGRRCRLVIFVFS